MVRLAHDVVAGRHLRVWGRGPGGDPVEAEASGDLAPGAPVAAGPADAAAADRDGALGALARLVEAGGEAAAGAGVDLGSGFRSARLDGARGDRRDAVLAALRALGPAGAERLGDRAGVLVALFGPAATKPVSAAAGRAMAEGRWAALSLASAASDVLGPEQLESVLALDAGPDIDPFGQGRASTLADQLDLVLGPLPGPRRLALLLDLWERVCAREAAARRRERLVAAAHGRHDRLDLVRERCRAFEDELLMKQVRDDVGHEPSLVEAARWMPEPYQLWSRLHRAVRNAICATVLLRAARSLFDHGAAEGLPRHRAELAAATKMLDPSLISRAGRKVPGRPGLPASPGVYVWDLNRRLRHGGPVDAKTAAYATQRLARARDYGIVVMETVNDLVFTLVNRAGGLPVESMHGWVTQGLAGWREAAGYTGVRPPSGWAQPPLFGPVTRDAQAPERDDTLAARLAARPGDRPEDVEWLGDLLWYADLGDALAQLHGHGAAAVEYDTVPHITYDPAPAEPPPLSPRLDSIPLAVAGAAQLVTLGGAAPRRSRTWAELVDGLRADTAIAEALTGTFALPVPLSPLDGTALPGTNVTLEWARDPRKLAEWSDYMGNCIAGPYYTEQATDGRCALAALRGPDGRVLINFELRPARPGGRSWGIAEMRARFNADPDPELAGKIRAWVAGLPPPDTRPPAVRPRPPRDRVARPAARRPARRLLHEAGEPLAALAEKTLAEDDVVRALDVLAALAPPDRTADPAGRPAKDPARSPAKDPAEALTALRRMRPERLARACRDALPEVGLIELWGATGVRPLTRALDGLDPAIRERHARLGLLPEDAPLPGSLRELARRPWIAPARSADLLARRIRATLGRLARDGDPALARCVARRPNIPLLCALAMAVTSWEDAAGPVTPVSRPRATTVPGFPAATLDDEDGPWMRAQTDALELGANLYAFWDRVAAGGLRVPAAWLGTGGWPALWNRAARNTPGAFTRS